MARLIPAARALPALRAYARGEQLSRADQLVAVRFTLQEFARSHPGQAVEIRVPPAGAVQAIGGPRHTRGTPPNVVECGIAVWLDLTLGQRSWDDACAGGAVQWSGTRADLNPYLPLVTEREWSIDDR